MAPIRDIIPRIAIPMPIALRHRLRDLGDLGPADHAIRHREPVAGPAGSEAADRIEQPRGRAARVARRPPRRELRDARGGDGAVGRCAHAAGREGDGARPASDGSDGSVSDVRRDARRLGIGVGGGRRLRRDLRGFAVEWCSGIGLHLAWARDLVRTTTVAREPCSLGAIGTRGYQRRDSSPSEPSIDSPESTMCRSRRWRTRRYCYRCRCLTIVLCWLGSISAISRRGPGNSGGKERSDDAGALRTDATWIRATVDGACRSD